LVLAGSDDIILNEDLGLIKRFSLEREDAILLLFLKAKHFF
jgi:hypothetical protein